MRRAKTPSFTIDIPLIASSQSEREIVARFNAGYRLYHACLNETEKRRKAMQADPEYALAKKLPKTVAAKSKGKVKPNPERIDAFKVLREKHGYSEYSLHDFSTGSAKASKWMASKLDAQVQQTIASRAFKASSRIIFGNARKIRFKPFHQFKSLEGKTNKQGLRWKDGSLVWGKLIIPAKLDADDEYQSECLANHAVKFVRLIRKDFNGKQRYFAQLVLKGVSPAKRRKDGSFKHMTRDLGVGIDLNVSNVGFVCEDGSAGLLPFAQDVPNYDKEVARLQRKMQRSQRVNNPECFEPSFPKRKGRKVIQAQGKFKKGARARNKSKRYHKLATQRREIMRKRSAYVKSQNRRLVNQILSYGNHILMENVTVKNWQKLWGKAISAKSPGFFQSELIRKAESAGGSATKFSTYSTACSQTHLDGQKRKKKLSDRVHYDASGAVMHRDIFAAFLALQVDGNKLPSAEVLLDKFSAMESSLLQAWQASGCPEVRKNVKLKSLIAARLGQVTDPQNVSAIKLGATNQIISLRRLDKLA